MRQQGLTEVLLYGLWHMGNRCTKAGTEVLAEGSCGNVDKGVKTGTGNQMAVQRCLRG